jgi:DnaJ-class molecular chaperone
MNAKPHARGGINSVRPQFTPGPWRADRSTGAVSATAQTDKVYNIVTCHTAFAPGEKWANAKLIANAPALFALAQQYASECAECAGVGVTIDNRDCEQCRDIRDVIHQAATP